MDTIDGGNYWGAIGRDPTWDKFFAGDQQGQPPRGLIRQTGGGLYAGVVVVLLAVWAAAQSLRKKNSVFDSIQRRWLWFWIAVGVISLLFGFGRYAPFYRLLYALPYFSTIRNPVKFLFTVVNFALVILFAYGVDGLWRGYLQRAKPGQPRAAVAHARFDLPLALRLPRHSGREPHCLGNLLLLAKFPRRLFDHHSNDGPQSPPRRRFPVSSRSVGSCFSLSSPPD